jgi:hypothetical protein
MIGVLIHLSQLKNLVEEMNNPLIVCMRLKILSMIKLKELMKLLEEIVEFFVLHRKEIVLPATEIIKLLNYRRLQVFQAGIQFFVLGSEFFVLVPVHQNFNSLYRAAGSLKMKK